ncbi:MAG: ubiquinol-cytochrome c reductase iron-sulfur subunit [Cyanobacteriota bacterium]|nr:ubiquinol-cytochrome c reductase iron-sulfur subunit [Cyanobacteriota bacterium]
MDRREFFGWVGVGLVAASLPVALAACGDEETAETPPAQAPPTANEPPATEPPVVPEGYQAIGTIAALDAEGSIVDKTNRVVIFRNPETNEIAAVNSQCTHQGCTVAWETDEKSFACPCHGSKFGPDGAVLSPPAQQPLATYEVEQDGDNILVKLS